MSYQTNPFENIAIGYLALAGQESSTNIDNSSRAVRNIAIGIRALNNNSLVSIILELEIVHSLEMCLGH